MIEQRVMSCGITHKMGIKADNYQTHVLQCFDFSNLCSAGVILEVHSKVQYLVADNVRAFPQLRSA